ncbi:MAG: alpha/beta hydrolase, partial [Pseudomonadota bacterium]
TTCLLKTGRAGLAGKRINMTKTIQANSITLAYDTAGDVNNDTVVLIRGLGTQMIDWPVAFIKTLVDAGLHVVYFDNRDVGESQKFDHAGVPDMKTLVAKMRSGETVDTPYTLGDMAQDVISLLSALNIEKAHIMGISMGGMIAQLVAANHPMQTQSLISIMSSSGRPDLPPPSAEASRALTERPPAQDRESIIKHTAANAKIFGSPGYPEDEEARLKNAAAAYDRCYYPSGIARQMAAIVTDGNRVERLKTITAPTLVIHGEDDPLVPLAAGKDTAANIPSARLEVIKGMGHNIPIALAPQLAALVAEHAKHAH